jgi:hypothetical protein
MTDATMSIDWQQLMAKLVASPSSLTREEIAILKMTPAITPPMGIVPNFKNPPTIKSIQYGITSSLLALMLLVFLNRVYVKTFLMKKYGWDDLTLLLSVIGTLIYYSIAIWGTPKHNLDSRQPSDNCRMRTWQSGCSSVGYHHH